MASYISIGPRVVHSQSARAAFGRGVRARAMSNTIPLLQQKARPLEEIHQEMTSRKLPLLYDNLTFGQSFLLDNTLSDFLPPYPKEAGIPAPSTWSTAPPRLLRPGYHLVHFPSLSRLSQLLPDNTETDQSPGEPFVRRMWAGGRIRFLPQAAGALRIGTGQVSVCLERISDVKIKGNEGDEKVFVTIERRISSTEAHQDVDTGRTIFVDNASPRAEKETREKLMDDDAVSTIEERSIVFMRERTPEQAKKAASTPSKILKPSREAQFYHTTTPTPSLLFRFSALTWNAHSIHLDKHFTREIEGHRNLLFHGPLSLVMMVELLQRHLAKQGLISGKYPARTISEIEYRNMAPLYCEEKLRICGREKDNGEFDLWVENKDGGLAVKATAKTVQHQIEDL